MASYPKYSFVLTVSTAEGAAVEVNYYDNKADAQAAYASAVGDTEAYSDVFLYLEQLPSSERKASKLDGWYEDAYGNWRKVGNSDIID